MYTFNRGILFGLTIIITRGIISPQYEGRGLRNFSGGKPRDPHFSPLNIPVKLGRVLANDLKRT